MTTTDPSDAEILQELTNKRLSGREPLQCNACGRELHEGEHVVVRLHQDQYDQSWLTTGRFCPVCGPETTQGPKPFAAELIVRGQVGLTSNMEPREYVPILLAPEIVDRA